MSDLKAKKLELERMKVMTAKAEMEFKILERLEDIERIKKNILIQENRALEIDELLEEMKDG